MCHSPFTRKWLISSVLPGVEPVRASPLIPVRVLIRDDLPTFERPIKAYSGVFVFGHCATAGLLFTNVADLIIIIVIFFTTFAVVSCKDNKNAVISLFFA